MLFYIIALYLFFLTKLFFSNSSMLLFSFSYSKVKLISLSCGHAITPYLYKKIILFSFRFVKGQSKKLKLIIIGEKLWKNSESAYKNSRIAKWMPKWICEKVRLARIQLDNCQFKPHLRLRPPIRSSTWEDSGGLCEGQITKVIES